MDKKNLRKQYLAQRLALKKEDCHKRSLKICEHISEFCLNQKNVTQIFLFHGIYNEPQIHQLADKLWERYTVALPHVLSKTKIEFLKWDAQTQLQLSPYKILEPPSSSEKIIPDKNTLVLVPNLAMDREGYRLGYGAGYYDNFLGENKNVQSLGVNFSEFIVDRLPRDSWDRSVKWICTEKGVESVELTEQQP